MTSFPAYLISPQLRLSSRPPKIDATRIIEVCCFMKMSAGFVNFCRYQIHLHFPDESWVPIDIFIFKWRKGIQLQTRGAASLTPNMASIKNFITADGDIPAMTIKQRSGPERDLRRLSDTIGGLIWESARLGQSNLF